MARDSYYPEDEGAMGATSANSSTPTPEALERKNPNKDEGETTLVPLSLFKGKEVEPGDVEKVKVVRTYEDEVEIVCVSDYGKREKGEEMDRAMEEMDEMAEEE